MRGNLAAVLVLRAALGQAVPGEAERLFQQAVELQGAGKTSQAILAYRRYLELKPDSVEGRSNLGSALSREGRFEEAIEEYRKALAGAPGNPAILLNLGLSYYKSGRPREAAAEFASASRLLAEPNPQVQMLRASCALMLEDFAKAVALLEPMESAAAGDPGFDFLYGMALIRSGQDSRGSAAIDRLLKRGESAEVRLLMGTLKIQKSDYDGALEDLKKAVELNPKLPEANSRLGQLLLAKGNLSSAAESFRKELEINAGDFSSNLSLGVMAKQNQDYEESYRYLERALRARPDDQMARYQVATLHLAAGKHEQARAILKELVKASPDFIEAHASLATVYYRLERKEDAERERAIVRKLSSGVQASREVKQR